MNLISFINKNKLNISKDCLNLCNAGISKMKASKDVSHSEKHVYSLLSELNMLIKNEKQLNKSDIDFEVLLPSICWHDVWKATREFTQKLRIHIYEQEFDGIGSYFIFKKHVSQSNIESKKNKTIEKLILLHSKNTFLIFMNPFKRWLKSKSVEFCILTDIDSLDTIGIDRVKQIATKHIKKGDTDPLLFRIAYYWMSHNLNWMDNYKLEFAYSRSKFSDYGEKVKKETVKIFMDLLENKEYYFDTKNPNYKLIENFKPSERDLMLIKTYGAK